MKFLPFTSKKKKKIEILAAIKLNWQKRAKLNLLIPKQMTMLYSSNMVLLVAIPKPFIFSKEEKPNYKLISY